MLAQNLLLPTSSCAETYADPLNDPQGACLHSVGHCLAGAPQDSKLCNSFGSNVTFQILDSLRLVASRFNI